MNEIFFLCTGEYWFEYQLKTGIIRISKSLAAAADLPEFVENPYENQRFMSYFSDGQYEHIERIFKELGGDNELYEDELQFGSKWFHMIAKSAHNDDGGVAAVTGLLRDIDDGVKKLEQIESEDDRENYAEIPLSELNRDIPHITSAQANALMRYLKRMFSVVRLVDPEICMQFTIDAIGKIVEKPYRCYTDWNKSGRCDYCISSIVARTRKTMTKLEYVNNEIYNVSATYMIVDEHQYVLELATYVDYDLMFSANEKQEVLNVIASHNRQLYIDPVTRVYNRRYFDDKLRDLNGEFAFAMLDVDNFKQINDNYGHMAGDAALAALAAVIKDNIRSCDDIIRYGGDEFFLFFREMPRDAIGKKLKKILRAVENIRMDEYPGLKMTVSIGGAFEKGKLSQILWKADMAMYDAKNTKNSVAIYNK